MQFYSNSTETSGQNREQQQADSFTRSFLQADPSAPVQPIFFYCFNNYYHQLCELSTTLNNQLLLNNTLIDLKNAAQLAEAQCSEPAQSDCQARTTVSNKNTSQYQEPRDFRIMQIRLPKKKANKMEDDETDSYKPDDEYSRDIGFTQTSESKNVPKNYGKAIVIFIQRNEKYTKKVLKSFNIEQKDFMKTLEKAKRNLNTIKQLRSLWLDQDNPYAKVYRILTIEYLRKHSLPYIFNSRVENFHKHIKYRFKMIESVKDPFNFTHMKDF